ncbi:flavonol synthase [Tanacetum coccineum]
MWDHNNTTRFKEPTSSLVTAMFPLFGSKPPLRARWSRLAPFFFRIQATHSECWNFERDTNEEYAESMIGVANKLLGLLSKGLGLEEDEVKQALGGEDLIYMLKINYYPPCPCPELALGVAPHTDMSSITILVPNDVQGLQVFKDDHWYDVAYIPNALIIHIGDQIEILSNGKYKSVYHRSTVNKEKTRMSWPIFLEPPPEFEVGPIPKLVNKDDPPKYKTKKYKDYVYCKLNKLPQ